MRAGSPRAANPRVGCDAAGRTREGRIPQLLAALAEYQVLFFGAVLLLGGTPSMAYTAQAAAILAAALLVGYVWHARLPLPVRAATLAAGTLVAAPVALFYDLMLAAVAALWLVRSDGTYRLAEWEKLALAALLLLTLNPRSLSEMTHLPIGPLVLFSPESRKRPHAFGTPSITEFQTAISRHRNSSRQPKARGLRSKKQQ